MKTLTAIAACVLCAAASYGATNENWLVLHRESDRYCSLTPTNMPGGAGIVVTRLNRTPSGMPVYSPAELVRLFGDDEIDFDFADRIDRTFRFVSVGVTDGKFRFDERKFRDIWRKETSGDAEAR